MRRNLVIVLSVLLVLAAAAAVMGIPVVLAHAEIEECMPAIDGKVDTAPETLVCTTSQAMEAEGSSLTVLNADGVQVDKGDSAVDLDDPDRTKISVSLDTAKLTDGVYTVKWITVSADDGDEASGEFTFTVGDAAAAQPTASAQTTPAARSTPSAAATDDLTPYVTVNLKAGFPLDPFLVSVNGGGDVEASTLSAECVGYINENPTVTVNYTGDSDLVRVFYFTEHDATLVVKGPDGKFLCGDDFAELEQNPAVELESPAEGAYQIWVGSYDEGELIPGLLLLTAQEDLTPATFVLGDLIDRIEQGEQRPLLPLIRKGIQRAGTRATAVSEAKPLVVENVKAEGNIPAFDLPARDLFCNGFVSLVPSAIVNVPADSPHLIALFEGDADSTLVLIGPNNQVWCNDDFETGENTHPLIDVAAPEEGIYGVFVGRVNPEAPLTGRLTVTTAPGATPGPSSQ